MLRTRYSAVGTLLSPSGYHPTPTVRHSHECWSTHRKCLDPQLVLHRVLLSVLSHEVTTEQIGVLKYQALSATVVWKPTQHLNNMFNVSQLLEDRSHLAKKKPPILSLALNIELYKRNINIKLYERNIIDDQVPWQRPSIFNTHDQMNQSTTRVGARVSVSE